jgi:hypothetical protein
MRLKVTRTKAAVLALVRICQASLPLSPGSEMRREFIRLCVPKTSSGLI